MSEARFPPAALVDASARKRRACDALQWDACSTRTRSPRRLALLALPKQVFPPPTPAGIAV